MNTPDFQPPAVESRTEPATPSRRSKLAWLLQVLILAVIGTVGAVWLAAQDPGPQPQLGVLVVSPPNFVFNTTNPITFTIRIDTPTLNPTTVELQRVDADGNLLGTLGRMYDNGQQGDKQPGDRLFTASITLDVPELNKHYYRAKAAFRGNRQSAFSDVLPVDVWRPVHIIDPGVTLLIPPLSVPTTISVGDSDGSQFVDIEAFDANANRYSSVLRILLRANPQRYPISIWFGDSVDSSGSLVGAGVYTEHALSNSVTALVRSKPIPDSFLESEGPIGDVFATAAGSDTVIEITRSHDVTLIDFGYSHSSIRSLLLDIAGSMAQ